MGIMLRRIFVQKLLVESEGRMSQRRDDFLLIALAKRSAMALRDAIAAKKAPNPTDQHIGSRVRMRRKMLAMSQEQLAEALGITYQQVQKYRKAPTASGPAGCSKSPISFRCQ